MNNVIIDGKVINPKNSLDISDKNLLSHLPNDDNDFIFYVEIEDANSNGEDLTVICRFRTQSEYIKFKSTFKYGDYIYLTGSLISKNENKYNDICYYDILYVNSYYKVSKNSKQIDLAFMSGILGKNLFKNFKILNVNDNKIDILDNDHLLENSDQGKEVYILGNVEISTSIKGLADNAAFVDKLYVSKDTFLNILNKNIKKNNGKGNKNTIKLTEDHIFSNFNKIINYNHMTYYEQDIINFYTAMKNKGLVILAGPSGTGKTELVRCYAESLGLLNSKDNKNSNPQYLHIAVSPSWTDDTDLLGYYDVKEHKYYPSNTGLVDLLYDASQHKNRLYIVLLDEMNLSHIEYYFSQFLSVLELPEDDPNRCIRLYDKSYSRDSNSNNMVDSELPFGNNSNNRIHYPHSIPLYNNVLFVGTINIDESTKRITDKVLDRSNLIKINSYKFEADLFKSKNIKKLNQLLQKISPITTSQFNSFKKESKKNSLSLDNDLNSSRRIFLTDLNRLLKLMTDDKLEIGYREVKQINDYLCDLPNENSLIIKNYMNKYHDNDKYKNYSDVAFDYQLSQRILDKLLGSKYELYGLISILCDCMNGTTHFNNQRSTLTNDTLEVVDNIKQELTDLLDNKIPHDYSSKVIRRKWLELHNYGFTI